MTVGVGANPIAATADGRREAAAEGAREECGTLRERESASLVPALESPMPERLVNKEVAGRAPGMPGTEEDNSTVAPREVFLERGRVSDNVLSAFRNALTLAKRAWFEAVASYFEPAREAVELDVDNRRKDSFAPGYPDSVFDVLARDETSLRQSWD